MWRTPDSSSFIIETWSNHAQHCLRQSGHCRGYFLQVIEGADQQISDLLGRISSDPRHSDASMIYESDIDDRVCPQWSMDFEKVESATRTAPLILLVCWFPPARPRGTLRFRRLTGDTLDAPST